MGTGPGEDGEDQERPRHEVTLSAFRMLRHEVTNDQYRRLKPDHPGRGDLPVAGITWYEGYAYAAWLGGRLPTEAEWEYAARAGCLHTFCDRNGQETTVDAVARTMRNSRDPTTLELTAWPVMQLEPNPWGFYDMLGNIWEWTADRFGAYPSDPQVDPWTVSGTQGIVRAGCFGSAVIESRPARRQSIPPDVSIYFCGCRPVFPEPLSSGHPGSAVGSTPP